MLPSIQIAGLSECGPVAGFVTVASQSGRPSYDSPMVLSSIIPLLIAASASSHSDNSSNLGKWSNRITSAHRGLELGDPAEKPRLVDEVWIVAVVGPEFEARAGEVLAQP